MLEKVSFHFKGKRISVKSRECRGLNRILGLMFIRKEKAEALLFDFKKPVDLRIHSFFVFFPFVVVWLDKKNKIIEIKKVKPFTLSVKSKKPYTKLIEIPLNKRYSREIKALSISKF